MLFPRSARVIDIRTHRLERELPSGGVALRNVSRAVLRAGMTLATHGSIRVSDDEKARRLYVCGQCEWFRPSDERCAHARCACYLRVKTALRSERCPAGRW